ncbi:MAG: tRNA-intron lyase [Candidatus ainarchaeum sp.]|nr:tRNA-intron lyase [Candidatus ainarchaeum sp.]
MDTKSYLIEDKIIIEDSTLKGTLVEKGFGESKGRNLVLDLYEALFLITKEKLTIYEGKKKINAKRILEIGLKNDKRFYSKALVFSELRETHQVKTGLKFGFDFRLYPKGKKMGEAHSQYGVNVYPESEKLNMTQISRLTRLAGNIHIKTIIAVVDRENAINYYQMERKLF